VKRQRYHGTTPHNTNTSLHPWELNLIAVRQISKKMFSPKVSTTNNILTEQKEHKPTNNLRKLSDITHQNAAVLFRLASRSPRALSYIGHGTTSQQTNR